MVNVILEKAKEILDGKNTTIRIVTESGECVCGKLLSIKECWILIDSKDMKSGWYNTKYIKTIV